MIFSDYACDYIERGFSVIPIDPKTKRAAIKGWSEYCERIPTDEELDKWCKNARFANGNIGLCLGPASGIMAIDFDYNLPDSDRVENLVKGILPPTTVIKIGHKGWTAFYRYNPDVKSQSINKGYESHEPIRMIDVLSTGRQTVVPPSIHPITQKPYYWASPETLLDINIDDLEIVDMDMIEAFRSVGRIVKQIDYDSIGKKRGRHDVVFGHAIKRISYYKDLDDMIDDVVKFDKKRHALHPQGPYFEDASYLKRDDQNTYVKKLCERIVDYKKRAEAQSGHTWSIGSDSDFPTKETGFFSIHERVDSKGNIKTIMKPEYYELGKYMAEREYFINNDAQMFIYKNNYYKPVTKLDLKNQVMRLTNYRASPAQVEQFYSAVRTYCYNELPNDNTVGFLNVANGVVDIKNERLLKHDKKWFFKYILPHAYDPNAQCPNWLDFLSRVFMGDQALIDLSAEIFGYAFSGGDPWLHKAFLLYGEGRNGKSTYIDVLSQLMGEENTCSVPIENLNKPFSVVMADGKLANIVGEMTNREFSSEAFKIAVGGEPLTASHKGMPEYMLRFQARMFFACNSMPFMRDSTSGAYEKLCIIPFNYYFTEKERIPLFAKKYLYGEMSGILNWSLQGYARLVKRGRLPNVSAVSSMLDEYRSDSDSAYVWFSEFVSFDETRLDWIQFKDFYNHYKAFCLKEGLTLLSSQTFVRRINKHVRKLLLQRGQTCTERRTNTYQFNRVWVKIKANDSITLSY